jgi:lysophospholipase L1-like esterase
MRLLSNITFHLAVLATVASCGGQNPIQPPPPPPPPVEVQLACPTAIVREATSAQGTDVHFDAPTPTAGTPPFDVQCEPGSSSTFPIGETPVRCTATGADTAQASCGFTVRVIASRTIGKTKFMAFGDSISEGVVSLAPLVMLGPPDTYPFKLEQMLRTGYPTQEVVVANHGVSGERTNQGVLRLPGLLDAEKPEVLLLLEGVNAVRSLSAATQERHLQTMITAAKTRNVDVIIATVMPVAPNGKLQPASEYMAAIRALNTRIFQLANRNGLGDVVDLFALFDGNMHLLGADGLHPSIEGQTRIAEAFRDEIVRRYDKSSTASFRVSPTSFSARELAILPRFNVRLKPDTTYRTLRD